MMETTLDFFEVMCKCARPFPLYFSGPFGAACAFSPLFFGGGFDEG
jgi:hypothetical protein